MRELYWLTRKNLLRFFSDKRGALMSVLLPVVLGTLMGALLSPKAGPSDIRLLVVQQDESEAVSEFVRAIDAHDMFTVEKVELSQARERVGSGKASLALVLPPGSGAALSPAALFSGQRVQAHLLHDPSRSAQYSIARGLLTQVLFQELGRGLTDPTQLSEMFADSREQLRAAKLADPDSVSDELLAFLERGEAFAKAPDAGLPAAQGEGESESGDGGLQVPLEFTAEALTAKGPTSNYSHYAHNYAGMLLIFLLFAGTSSAQQLLREREDGVLVRVQAAHVTRGTLVLSVAISTSLIALLSSLAVYAIGIFAFGIEVHGAAFGFALVLLAQAMFVGSFAALLVGVGRSEKQISSLSTLLVLPAGLLGGAMLPSFLFPDWLQAAQRFMPTYWATHGLAAMTWRGSPMSEAWICTAALLGFALVFTLVAVRRFRWSAQD